eukprot:scaffold666_cov332-Prasinococcus_capsulatus_cf.AAC.20
MGCVKGGEEGDLIRDDAFLRLSHWSKTDCPLQMPRVLSWPPLPRCPCRALAPTHRSTSPPLGRPKRRRSHEAQCLLTTDHGLKPRWGSERPPDPRLGLTSEGPSTGSPRGRVGPLGVRRGRTWPSLTPATALMELGLMAEQATRR